MQAQAVRERPATLDGPRPARVEEQAELIAMLEVIFRTSRGWPPSIGVDWPHVYAPANLENVHIFTDNGRIVASTGVWANEIALGPARLRIGGISCVGTLDEYRRYGLASQLMQAAQRRMAELGCHVGELATGIPNWYRRLGWEWGGAAHSYQLARGNIDLLPHLPADVTGRVAERGDYAAIVALRNAAEWGGLCDAAEFALLVAARGLAGIYVAERAGVLIAYVMWKDSTVHEWGGPVEVVAGLVHALYAHLDDPGASTSQRNAEHRADSIQRLTLVTPEGSRGLAPMLDRLRIPAHTDYVGMLYVVNPAAILAAFGIHEIAVEEADGEFILHSGGVSARFDRCRLTKLFFGPERVSDLGDGLFPLPFWQWYLEKV